MFRTLIQMRICFCKVLHDFPFSSSVIPTECEGGCSANRNNLLKVYWASLMCLAYDFYRNKSRPEHAFILLATLNNVDVFGIGRLAQFLIEISHGQEADY